jgi:hypothetical protein
MSKQKQREEANDASPETNGIVAGYARDTVPQEARFLPLPVMALFVVFIAGGVLLGMTRESSTESQLSSALDSCDAGTIAEMDGLNDAYGVVRFKSKQDDIGDYLSLCHTKPKSALKIYRSAFERRSKSARLVAIHSAYFLAVSGSLEKSDFDLIVNNLDPEKEKDLDLRHAAQRALSQLIIIADVANQTKYRSIPDGVKAEGVNRIETREETLRPSGSNVLNIRWTNPDLAFEWVRTFLSQGQWDAKLQRFMIGKSSDPAK